MWIKQRNRACETLLEKWAEPFSAWAELLRKGPPPPGYVRNPAEILRQAWRTVDGKPSPQFDLRLLD